MFLVVLAGFVREVLIARGFGASAQVDAYVVCFSLLTYLPMVVAFVVQASFIPKFSEVLLREPSRAWKMASTMLNYLIAIFGLVGALIFLAKTSLIRLFAPGFAGEQVSFAVLVLDTLLPVVVLTILNEYLKTVLNCLKVFWWPSFSQALPALFAIAAILMGERSYGILALAVGLLGGVVAQSLLLFLVAVRSGFKYYFAFNWRRARLGEVVSLGLPYVFVEFAIITPFIVDRYFASQMAVGSVTYLFFADRLVRVPIWLITIPLFTSAHPYLSDKANLEGSAAIKHSLATLVHAVTLVCLPITVCMAAASRPMVGAVFQGGAFGEKDTFVTAWLVTLTAPQIFLATVYYLFDRVTMILRDRKTLLIVGCSMIVTKILGSWLLIRPFKIYGLALASDLMYLFAVVILYRAFVKREGHIALRRETADYVKIAVATIVTGLAVVAAFKIQFLSVAGNQGMMLKMLKVGGVGLFATACYAFLVQFLRVRGVRELLAGGGSSLPDHAPLGGGPQA